MIHNEEIRAMNLKILADTTTSLRKFKHSSPVVRFGGNTAVPCDVGGLPSKSGKKSSPGKASVLGTTANLKALFGEPGRMSTSKTKEELQSAFAIQIVKLEGLGASVALVNSHLAKNKESGFDLALSLPMRKLCGSLDREIMEAETHLPLFLARLTPMEKQLCLSTPNDGSYAKKWLRTFKPLLVQLNTLVKELKGTALPILCSIAELQYPKRGLTLMSPHIGLVTLLIVHFNYLCLRL